MFGSVAELTFEGFRAWTHVAIRVLHVTQVDTGSTFALKTCHSRPLSPWAALLPAPRNTHSPRHRSILRGGGSYERGTLVGVRGLHAPRTTRMRPSRPRNLLGLHLTSVHRGSFFALKMFHSRLLSRWAVLFHLGPECSKEILKGSRQADGMQ